MSHISHFNIFSCMFIYLDNEILYNSLSSIVRLILLTYLLHSPTFLALELNAAHRQIGRIERKVHLQQFGMRCQSTNVTTTIDTTICAVRKIVTGFGGQEPLIASGTAATTTTTTTTTGSGGTALFRHLGISVLVDHTKFGGTRHLLDGMGPLSDKRRESGQWCSRPCHIIHYNLATVQRHHSAAFGLRVRVTRIVPHRLLALPTLPQRVVDVRIVVHERVRIRTDTLVLALRVL